MTDEQENAQPNNVLSGLLILFYAGLVLLGSFLVWTYSENLYLWAWHYELTHFLSIRSYSNLFKAASLVISVPGLVGVGWGLMLVLEGMTRQLRGS